MKKTFFMALLFAFVFVGCNGCAGISVNQNTQAVVAKIAAQILAFKAAEKHPDMIEPAKLFCAALQDGEINQALLATAKAYLIEKFNGDPLLMASLVELTGLIQIQPGETYDNELVKAAAAGFLSGIQLYESDQPGR